MDHTAEVSLPAGVLFARVHTVVVLEIKRNFNEYMSRYKKIILSLNYFLTSQALS